MIKHRNVGFHAPVTLSTDGSEFCQQIEAVIKRRSTGKKNADRGVRVDNGEVIGDVVTDDGRAITVAGDPNKAPLVTSLSPNRHNGAPSSATRRLAR